ncbi:MAG: ferrous iron transport protein B [Ruminococcus sp.]|jgi:ferrous iron transport protein B|nr:ferrous iron transport protein B [Ruminococcus sp.]MEE0005467.1 ferrous iron transport protein B [Ruminococcus sp.]
MVESLGDKMNIKIGLAGNPNCGKTTLFNLLTGSNQYVGNWSGVTVESKEGILKNHNNITITDLPGIYSLSPYSPEEVVARNYLVDEKPNVIINIVDGTKLERNLYLTLQLMEIGVPIVVAINMMDVVRKNGGKIYIEKLSKILGIKVVEISALKNLGIDNLINTTIQVANNKTSPPKFMKYNSNVENTLQYIESKINNNSVKEKSRYYSVKIFEKDKYILNSLNLNLETIKKINSKINSCEELYNDESVALIINDRYKFVEVLLSNCYSAGSKSCDSSNKVDNILLGKYTAIPIFILIIFLIYYISVSLVGNCTSDFITSVIFDDLLSNNIKTFLTDINCSNILISLINEGIINGVGSVIAFVPELIALFFFLGILEDIGYMSRIAFIMDKIFRKFGLSGKSIIPLLISSGCGVPAIMSTKTIENKKQKIITVITTTNVPCSAKLQIIALISSAIFSNNFLVAPIIYFSSIIFVLISSLILSNLNIITTTDSPFIMEIPNYHLPSLTTIFTYLFQRIKAFLIKAGTVLVVACIIIWLLSNFGFANGKFTYLNGENQNNSLMCYFSASISNLFYPLGFNNWQCISATFSGIFAKENIVSSLNVFLNSNETIKSVLPTYSSAISFLVFNLLNSPCIASIIAMKKELVSKKLFIFALLYQNIFAYIISLIIYQLIGFFLGEVQLNVFTIVSIFFVGIIINILLKKKPSKI